MVRKEPRVKERILPLRYCSCVRPAAYKECANSGGTTGRCGLLRHPAGARHRDRTGRPLPTMHGRHKRPGGPAATEGDEGIPPTNLHEWTHATIRDHWCAFVGHD